MNTSHLPKLAAVVAVRVHTERGEGVGILGPLGQIDIDVVIHGSGQAGGSDQGHDADQAFNQHGSIADHANVELIADHLRSGARADQGVEPGNGSTHNANEDVGENRAVEIRAAAVGELRVDRWRLKHWIRDQYTDDQ